MPLPPDPAAARTLEVIATVQRQLGDAVTRLADVSARARQVADATEWRTDAAALFHTDAQAWRREVSTLSDSVDDARDQVGRLRARVEEHVWRYGV